MTVGGPQPQNVSPELERRRQRELAAWQTAHEGPESDLVHNLALKGPELGMLLDLVERYRDRFGFAKAILELGAGQGFACCLVKRLFPTARVVASDLSLDALASAPKWEHVFDVALDGTVPCPSERLPFPDESQDLVFCFQAAHHFVRHRRTLAELSRVLRPGGSALYLHEPACPGWIYPLALRRVTRKRQAVPEDVLRYGELAQLARAAGLRCEVDFYPTVRHRGPAETIYYSMLARLPVLQRLLPCTANFVFVKPDDGPSPP